ncbi:competence protein ComEA [Kitasatospora viridis]|uniref:Competence protein ComEA n=1 Tax=Kitasatospora viridis TaxID=281105 RepID=A0A561UL56_9ACTN|nr:competence protein ComEA [Kitasatospora viridis]
MKPDRVRAPGVVADTHPHPPRRRFRLPAALHPLLWADRKAVLGLGVLLLLAVAYAVQHFWLGRPQPVAVPAITGKASRSAVPAVAPAEPAGEPGPEDPSAPEPGHPAASEVVIDVAGRVLQPGVRALPAGSRVADALRAAGGPQPGVDTDGLNLARVLVDGEQVLVGLPVQAGGGSGQSATRGPVSINRATAEQLDALPGIGPVLARHILDFRTQHGSFRSLDQLRQISGIGERKYAELKLLLTL